MIRILATTLAALLGLAFGSFLNVCLSRWPQGESVVEPRSHCRNCGRTLPWWENVPLLSWLALRGQCRTCHSKISWRYPLVEFIVGALWASIAWRALPELSDPFLPALIKAADFVPELGFALLCWMLTALAFLDAENLWLPDWITLPGIGLGFFVAIARGVLVAVSPLHDTMHGFDTIKYEVEPAVVRALLGSLGAAGLILLIRWTYWLIRKREGIGLGDAKLMAMLGAWLGLTGALLSFAIGVMIGAVFALVVLAIPTARRESDNWLLSKMPLGTFLCVGGIISALWGPPLIAAYLRLVGIR